MDELKIIKNALETLHASQNAINFFLTSYKIGRATVGVIAKQANMDRSSAYLACEQLQTLGVLDEDNSLGKKTVIAKPPQAVIARLRTEIRRLRREVEEIEQHLPSLSAVYAAASDRPVVQVFTGEDGLHQIMEDVLANAKEEILLFSNFEEEQKVFSSSDHDDFIKRRILLGHSLRLIAVDSLFARQLQASDRSSLRQTKICKEANPFVSETYIYGDSIAMLSFNERSGIVGFIIRSKDFVQTERWLFESMWSALPKE